MDLGFVQKKLTPKEHAVMKIADKLDALYHSSIEISLGNRHYQPVAQALKESIINRLDLELITPTVKF